MKFLILILSLLLPSVLSAQTITVFTNRAAFEAAMGSFKVVDDFSTGGTFLEVTTTNGANNGSGKWADILRDPEPSTVWATPFGSTAFGGTWDTSPSGAGGGLAFELDFGGGNIVTVPGNVPGNSPANVFLDSPPASHFSRFGNGRSIQRAIPCRKRTRWTISRSRCLQISRTHSSRRPARAHGIRPRIGIPPLCRGQISARSSSQRAAR